MRNTCDSSKIESTVSLSSRASCRVVPNGFSMITRTATRSWWSSFERPSSCTITGKKPGDVDR